MAKALVAGQSKKAPALKTQAASAAAVAVAAMPETKSRQYSGEELEAMREEFYRARKIPINRYRSRCTLCGMFLGGLMVILVWNAMKLGFPWGLVTAVLTVCGCLMLAGFLAIKLEGIRDTAYVPPGLHGDFFVGFGFYGPAIVGLVWMIMNPGL